MTKSDAYWKHAHRDWRVWVGALFIVVAMIVYVMSDDLMWRPRVNRQPPASAVPR